MVLALILLVSAVFGLFPTIPAANAATVYCNLKFSKPAICCDAGEVIDLTSCGVQFAADGMMTTSGITWTYNGSTVKTFTPSARGVYTLTAKSGSNTKTIYVVAKNPEETEYVLYRNDFDALPNNYRIPEQTSGTSITASGGNLILDASGNAGYYIRILLPSYLDAFGDATVKASMKMASAVDNKKWASLMYRVQSGNYPFYQGCLRKDATLSNGVEISQRNRSYEWDVYKNSSFGYAYAADYNLFSITAKGTDSVFKINGYEVLQHSETEYATGGFGFQTRGTKLMVDYVEITLDGNDPINVSSDVSFAKPAIRADMGDTIDLTACDVQFAANAIYTDGSKITWRRNGFVITSFTPASAGVTALTATSGGVTKNVYVVTRNLSDGEYVMYQNNFDTAPTDFRVIEKTNSSVYHDGLGNYVIDASASADSYSRVLLPSFLDEFGDFKLETSYKDTNANTERNWSSLMAHVQNNNYPYIQMCVRNNTNVADGIEIAERTAQNLWNVYTKSTYADKVSGGYNTYALTVQNNKIYGAINGSTVISYDEHPYVAGAMGIQARGLKLTIDYVKVTLGNTTAQKDTAVKCFVSKARPAIGCNAGQTILLDQCAVQFTYGSYAVDGSQITWKKDGQVITEFSDTSLGMHTLTATHGDTTMNVYVIAKKTTAREYVLYSNDFTNGPTDYRVPEASNGGTVYPINGTFVLNGSANDNAYVRVLMPAFLDQFGDANFEASIMLSAPVDNTKWGAILYRTQNGTVPYMQCCYRYNSAASNGVEISQRTAEGTWNVLQKGSTTAHSAGGYNVIRVNVSNVNTSFSINGTQVLSTTGTPYHNGAWGFQVRGLTMTLDYVRLSFTSNYSSVSMYTIPGGYVDVRQPSTGISVAPVLVTDVKTKADFDNILTNCPAVAIMNYDVIDGVAKIVFSDGVIMPDEALDKLGAKIIPAFRINDNADADSLASFLKGRSQRDAYAVSTNLAVLNRAYSNWKYIRGVADYSSYTSFDPEELRYNALANSARVLILPESASRDAITQIQDSYSCVWLAISEGKTASVAATNKGPYGLITPDRALTEYCYQNYYGDNTLIRRTNVVGHRGIPSMAPENTILGTQTAYSNGANMVENDIYLTTDGVVVVMHDTTLDRTTNGSGTVTDLSYAQIKNYKVDYYSGVAAQPIPTLEDYFKSIKGNPKQRLVIEMKHPPEASLANAMSALIKKYDIMDQVVIISFIQNNLIYTSRNLPGAPVGWLNWLKLDENNPVYATYETLENVQPYNCVCSPGYDGWGSAVIEELVARGVTLWTWTVNKQDQFDKLMIDGVGGITTDYSQWSKPFIESIHWNSASRVISSTYHEVLTDVTNSAEVVVIEDTLGIKCSAGNITVPETEKGGKATFYYRYKSTTPTGIPYYTVTEIRTIEVASKQNFALTAGSQLTLANGQLTGVTENNTVAQIKRQFVDPVAVLDKNGNVLADTAYVTTGSTVYLVSAPEKRAVIVIKGDVNGDGVVSRLDYLEVKNYFLNVTNLTGVYFTAADCDNDGVITSTDYLRIKSHCMNLFDLFG